MKRIIVACLAGAVFSLAATPADALAARTFVSSGGTDTTECTRVAPCRSFAYAIGKTAAGGEINTLDPGGYGPVTIDKSISIVSGLGEAGVLVPPGAAGIFIYAGLNDQINLRGLAIEGAGTGRYGILFEKGGSLTISNSVVRNVTDAAIDLEPVGTGQNICQIVINDTLATDTDGVGVYIYPRAAKVRAVLTRVTSSNNRWGVYANGNDPNDLQPYFVDVSVVQSTIANNTKGDGFGIYSNGLPVSGGGLNTNIEVESSFVAYNNVGIKSASGIVTMSNTRVLENQHDLSCIGQPVVNSYGNNVFRINSSCSVTNLSFK